MRNKRIVILVILILISIVTLIGSSYALLTKSFKGDKLSMQVGTLKVDFTEGNSINLNNTIPMSDTDGLSTTPYTFTITNSGTIDAYYTVSNEEDSSNTLDTSYLKMRLTSDDGYDSGIVKVKELGKETYQLVSSTLLTKNKSVTYKLYLWVSSDADNSIQNKTFKSKIVVDSASSKVLTVAEKLLAGVGDKGSIDKTDPEQTFIAGEDPNNYIWYSGKLWRAVSIDPTDSSVKLVTQWNIAAVSYNSTNNSTFKGSHMEQWLNDTSVDGFLGNLREPEKFIKTDSVWNATMTTDTSKIAKTTMVTDTVGLLNVYEYTMSYNGTTSKKGYLQNTDYWRLLNPYDANNVWYVDVSSVTHYNNSNDTLGIRPSINLKPTVKIISGTGTLEDPYKVENDNPTGTLLSARYSGEYISFGTGENNLYRIVSHENGLGTKIVSDSPIINTTIKFNNIIDKALNNTYLKTLTTEQLKMIEDNTTWYNSLVPKGDSYKLAKGTDTFVKKIGMLRYGELMTGQVNTNSNAIHYWLLNGYDENNNWVMTPYGSYYYYNTSESYFSYKPAMNLKANVIITGGRGTRNEPFLVKLKN